MAAEVREPDARPVPAGAGGTGALSDPPGGSGPSIPARLFFIAAGAVAVGLASAMSIAGPQPSLLTPFSMVVVVPNLVLGSRSSLGFAPILFVVTAAGLLRRQPSMAMPVACFVGLAISSALWLAWGYDQGMRHYGAAYTHGLIGINALSAGILAALMIHARQRRTFAAGLLLHALTWCWASWSAFGWLRQVL